MRGKAARLPSQKLLIHIDVLRIDHIELQVIRLACGQAVFLARVTYDDLSGHNERVSYCKSRRHPYAEEARRTGVRRTP